MRKYKIIKPFWLFGFMVLLVLCFASCNSRESSATSPQSASPLPATASDASSSPDQESVPSTITPSDVSHYFKLKKSELLELFGPNYFIGPAGGEGSYDGYYYSTPQVMFIFNGDRLEYMDVPADFDLYGARAGMNFEEIQKILGSTEVKNTFIETPDHPTYTISYTFDNCTYSFTSLEKDGSDSTLDISGNYNT